MLKTWLIPGLLGPLPRYAELPPDLRLPNLEKLLARANQGAGPLNLHSALCDSFGLADTIHADFPSAAFSWLGETGASADFPLMHADPVYLKPDQDRLLLSDQPKFDVTAEESAQFRQAFNAHFANDGLELVVSKQNHWYLRSRSDFAIQTAPLDEVIGRNIDLFLPTGEKKRFWRGLLNETQMLFFNFESNQQRMELGKVPINGIWLSGAGALPGQIEAKTQSIAGDLDALLLGLAKRGEVIVENEASKAELVVNLQAWRPLLESDLYAWVEALQTIEQEVNGWLKAGSECVLLPCDGRRFVWKPAFRRHFWHKSKPIATWILRDCT